MITKELDKSAIIREVHVYGPAQNLGSTNKDKAQHIGLGTRLINEASQIATKNNFTKLNVISAIGTREYYKKKGFEGGDLYQYISTGKKIQS